MGCEVPEVGRSAPLVQRYFPEPYRFIAPYRSTFWCRIARYLVPRQLRRNMQVTRWQFQGIERLRASLTAGAGIILSSNHSRWPDPLVLGTLGVEMRQYFYYVASYHLFKLSRSMGWVINRIGAFSVNREGSDREAIRTCAGILASAERPLVIFPEGTWFRQNDRLGPLQEGLTLILRQAAQGSQRPLAVHPVGIKYWSLIDPRPELVRRLERLERHLGWSPQRHLDLVPRIEKLSGGLVALKEYEHFGEARPGSLDLRLANLIDAKVVAHEKRHLGRTQDGLRLERIRRIRQRLVPQLTDLSGASEERQRLLETLDDLLLCENLNAHSLEYLRERPSLERLTEAVERLEETFHDEVEQAVAPMGVVVEIGPALDGRLFAQGRGSDPSVASPMRQLADAMQSRLDALLAQGPPRAWGCPPAVESAGPVSASVTPLRG
jgi:1-acyl-sn-glycerol-3-phosphate acyltransferase